MLSVTRLAKTVQPLLTTVAEEAARETGFIRRVRRLVPRARQVKVRAHDYDRPGKPDCAWDDPEARQALVSRLVNDALALLAAVAEVELDAEQAEAVALLGGSPAGSPRIGSSQSSTRRPATPARPAPTNATATRATSPPSPSPGW